eukprot:scaffold5231_cov119-Isochrysis_galbana.AAC.8
MRASSSSSAAATAAFLVCRRARREARGACVARPFSAWPPCPACSNSIMYVWCVRPYYENLLRVACS